MRFCLAFAFGSLILYTVCLKYDAFKFSDTALSVELCALAAVNVDYAMEGTNVALAVFIPTAVILVVVLGIYVYFAK